MTEFDAVVFDMDGVIFDSERGVMGCWLELAKKHVIKDVEKNILKCMGTTKVRTREIMMEAYGPEFPYEQYAGEASALFHEKFDDGRLPVKPGVLEILRFLKENGKKIALASSTRRVVVEKELSDAGLIGYFDKIICGDMVEKSKPAPDIFLKACAELGVEPASAIAIEDSYNGIRSAAAGGLRAVMVPDLVPPDAEMQSLAETILSSLHDVIDYLK